MGDNNCENEDCDGNVVWIDGTDFTFDSDYMSLIEVGVHVKSRDTPERRYSPNIVKKKRSQTTVQEDSKP